MSYLIFITKIVNKDEKSSKITYVTVPTSTLGMVIKNATPTFKYFK